MSDSPIQFASIKDAIRLTGLSGYALRRGCRDGSIPCMRQPAGQRSKYYINLTAWKEQLDREIRGGDSA